MSGTDSPIMEHTRGKRNREMDVTSATNPNIALDYSSLQLNRYDNYVFKISTKSKLSKMVELSYVSITNKISSYMVFNLYSDFIFQGEGNKGGVRVRLELWGSKGQCRWPYSFCFGQFSLPISY